MKIENVCERLLFGRRFERPSAGVEEIDEKCGQKGPKTKIGVRVGYILSPIPVSKDGGSAKKEFTKVLRV